MGKEQVRDRLSMASLFGSRPERSCGLHNSLAGDTARRKHAGFQQCIIIFDFSVCSAASLWWGRQREVREEGQDSDTLQSSVSFCRTNSPKQIPMARDLATTTRVLSGGGAVLEPGPGHRGPEIHLRSGPHQVHRSPAGCQEAGAVVAGSA